MQSMIYIVITTLLAILFVGCGDPRATPATHVNQDIDAGPLQSRVENHTVDPPAIKVTDAGPQKSEVKNHTLEHIRSLRLAERPGWGGFVVVESNSSALGGRNTYKLSAYIEVHPRDADVDALLLRLNTSYDRACPSGDTCPAWGPTLVEGTTFKAIQRAASILGDSCTTYAIGADATQTYVYDVRLLELDCVQPMSHSSLTSVLKELGLVVP